MIAKTPRGFKDVLPSEARIREKLRRDVARVMDLWGYDPIETPSLESVASLEQGSALDTTTFRLFDGDGNLLVMRPDATLPIARMVASRLKDDQADSSVHRFRYDLSVFRDNESAKGHSREFTQLGIELIGLADPQADAETLIVFIESLRAAGLEGFKIEFCDVRALNGLLAACKGLGCDIEDQVRDAYHTSNNVQLDAVVDGAGLPFEIAQALKGMFRIHGGRQAIAQCGQLLGRYIDPAVLEGLECTWQAVEECGYAGYMGIDFSLLSSFDYYTGFVMQAFAPGFGKSLGSGGRYDRLLGKFGSPKPAAGFAFSLERLMHALAVQGNLAMPAGRKAYASTFSEAMQLHEAGTVAVMGGAL